MIGPSLFNASTPAVRQGFSWDCAAASLAWLLSSAGVPTTEAAAISILGPNVNPSVGLTDASGSGVVASLAAQGIAATNGGLGFDDAKGLAGSVPLMIGGAAFNHWTGVSGVDGDSLVLANPAPGWMGVGDRMSRAQFAALGPFSGVWLTGVAVGAGGPTIAGVQLNPWMLLGAAVAVLLLVDGEDILPNPDFYTVRGVVHPIRHSSDYDPEVDDVQRAVKIAGAQAEKYRGLHRGLRREKFGRLEGGVDRPPWAGSYSDGQLERIARDHGQRATTEGWWERAHLWSGSAELRKLREGGYRQEKRSKPDRHPTARPTTAKDRAYAARAGRRDFSDLPF